MATMVALGHLKGLTEIPSVERFFLPFMGAAVPTFFVISAFLFWRKPIIPSIWKYCSRLLLLYVGWHIVYSPIKIHQYAMGNSGGVISFTKDFLCGYSLSGGWFVASLIWGMLLLYVLKRCKVPDWTIVVAAIFTYVFVYMHDLFDSAILNSAYSRIQYILNNRIIYSPFVSFPWIVLGYVLGRTKAIIKMERCKYGRLLAGFIGLCSMCIGMAYPHYWYLPTITLTWSLFMFFYMQEIKEWALWKYLRNYSIIVFFVHFFFMRFIFEPKVLSFVTFYVLSILIAMAVVFLSGKRYFNILRKLY